MAKLLKRIIIVFILFIACLFILHKIKSINVTTTHSNIYISTIKKKEKNQLQILILIPSLLHEHQLRMRVRTGYGQCSFISNNFPIILRFYIAESSIAMDEQRWQLFHDEMSLYKDIVWDRGLTDTYRNLSAKMIRSLSWVQNHFPQVHFVVKADIEVFIHIENLVKNLLLIVKSWNNTFHISHPVLIGAQNSYQEVVRKTNVKFYVSIEEFSESIYPTYVSGASYIINQKAIKTILLNYHQMYEMSPTSNCTQPIGHCPTIRPLVPMEDAFITGILLRNVSDLERVNYADKMCPNKCPNHNETVAITTDNGWTEFQFPQLNCSKINFFINNQTV